MLVLPASRTGVPVRISMDSCFVVGGAGILAVEFTTAKSRDVLIGILSGPEGAKLSNFICRAAHPRTEIPGCQN